MTTRFGIVTERYSSASIDPMFFPSLKTGTMKSTISDATDGHLFPDPRHDLVESFRDAGGRFEFQDPFCFLGARDPPLYVVAERFVGNVSERIAGADLLPDQLGELQHRHRLRRGEIEILIARIGRFDRQANSAREIAAIRVMPDLIATAEDVKRVLTLEDFLHEVGNDMAHREADVTRHHCAFDGRARFADSDAVERPHDRVWQAVLL